MIHSGQELFRETRQALLGYGALGKRANVSRPARLAAALLLLTLVLLTGVREVYAPRLSLPLKDLLSGAPRPETVRLSDELSLRLYGTTRPHVGKVAALQKGLVLVHKGKELIEEGYGFGLPIVEINGTAHMSRRADVALCRRGKDPILIKSYQIDVADRPTQPFRKKYADVAPVGTVVFTYTVRPPDALEVAVDFRELDADWQRAYLMNEQGAGPFTRYVGAAGEELEAQEMGIWEQSRAPFGCWEGPARGVRFCVEAPPGQRGFVGRERYRQYNWLGFYALSWSGIDIAVEAPREIYTYTIRIEEGVGP